MQPTSTKHLEICKICDSFKDFQKSTWVSSGENEDVIDGTTVIMENARFPLSE